MKNILTIKKEIFVNEKVIGQINIPEDYKFHVFNENIREKIESVFSKTGKKPFIALFCINENDYYRFREIISSYSDDNFIYNFIIQINSDDDHNPVFNNIDIGHIWHGKISKSEFTFAVKNLSHILTERYIDNFNTSHSLALLIDMKQDQEDLINIGRGLSIEKDPEKLLRLILNLSKKITGADAGSIYLVEENSDGEKQIRIKYSHTFSKPIPMEDYVLPYDTSSITGYVAITGNILNIPDVYKISPDDPISFNNSFDIKNNYRTKSILVVPMRNHIDEIIGVIQLINSKESGDARFTTGNEAFEVELKTDEDFENKVSKFAERYEHLMESIAGQAAISIENNRMIKQIENQFEEFVKASVTAIESRDPATSGHSFRVAEICTKLADAVNAENTGVFKNIFFSENKLKELEYAALLHDFGKVYIDLAIFMKSKKLYPKELENLLLKFNYLYRYVELQSETDGNMNKAADSKDEVLRKIKEITKTIINLNEPTVLENDPAETINTINNDISSIECYDIEGHYIEIINGHERTNLSIRRGSLNDLERKEIESHVVHTYNFVKRIPWPPEYKDIPKIAQMHHEKNDGSGYPYGLKEKDIPLAAQIMAIADIYDALTATDRPYKKAIPHEKALKIIIDEADHGKLNADLVKLFVKNEININTLEYQIKSMSA
ncbi:MAG: HD domain-containing protein [Spirochaetes bacterium]|nr:HD domain-containing protein [Spirochaetota bacterium]